MITVPTVWLYYSDNYHWVDAKGYDGCGTDERITGTTTVTGTTRIS